jgi:hypothetical protein
MVLVGAAHNWEYFAVLHVCTHKITDHTLKEGHTIKVNASISGHPCHRDLQHPNGNVKPILHVTFYGEEKVVKKHKVHLITILLHQLHQGHNNFHLHS